MKYVVIAIVIWNVVNFAMMGLDKQFAKKHKRRISEATLLGSAFVFGGIGSIFGMYLFRHKTKHLKFIILEPIAIAVNILSFVGIHTILS
ncbi:MAG: DUF1294 domain-containing protein [Clostridiales bacterium]|nr:DUF1294 domain-containing protein [Clostridiales bacterium]